ncbi:MAG: DUF6328 family protein [Chloroflexota bacterium]
MPTDPDSSNENNKDSDQDLNDMLQESRILLQGAQVLTAFLTILPFNQRFDRIDETEKWVYVATFIMSVASLILFTAPAAQHRLIRPLTRRVEFKDRATRLMIAGMALSSIALVLTAQLVVSSVVSGPYSLMASGVIAILIGALWWIMPLRYKEKDRQ